MRKVGISLAAGISVAAITTAAVLGSADVGAHSSSPVADTASIKAACTAGTWVQQSADVTPAMVNGALTAITVVSATNAWAVGEYNTGSATGSLWEHYNGTSWSVIGNGGPGVSFNAMTNAGANDVVAVGESGGPSNPQAIISEWNGSSIVRASLPIKGLYSSLFSVSAFSASDIWAVGFYRVGNNSHVLNYHYNGSAWLVAPSPTKVVGGGYDVLALSPTDVYETVLPESGPVALYQWNGAAWAVSKADIYGPVHRMAGPLAGTSNDDLYGLQDNAQQYNVAEHWNGSNWLKVGVRVMGDNPVDIAEGPVGTIWSAGYTGSFTGIIIEENATVSLSFADGNELLYGVAAGSGVVFAVGGSSLLYEGGVPTGEPIVYMGCE